MTTETLYQDAAARDWTDDALARVLDEASHSLLAREYGVAATRLATLWTATAHVALPVPIAARLRRLRAAALRAQGGRDRIHKAIEILDRGIELHHSDAGEVAAYWLDLGRTYAVLHDANAVRCFLMATAAAGAVLARAALEHARWRATHDRVRDRGVARMIARSLIHNAELHGAPHPFSDGVQVFAHARARHVTTAGGWLGEPFERVVGLAAHERLATDVWRAIDVGLDRIRHRELVLAEACFRRAWQLGSTRTALHALAMVLYAQGKFEEAEAAASSLTE
jgi:hypothetical protein